MPLSDRDRDALIAQVRHLLDELDAFEPLVASIPEDILTARPVPREPSITEMYALIGLYDVYVYLPALEAMVGDDLPVIQEGDDDALLAREAWNNQPFSKVLEFTRRSRKQLIQFLESLTREAWARTAQIGDRNLSVKDAVYGVVQHDAEILRAAAHRFHDVRPSI